MNPGSKNEMVEPEFRVGVIKLRQPDGSLLVMAGQPQVSIAQFAKETGISNRHIATLCEQGLIEHRRLTPKNGSKILIPHSEVDRFLALDDESKTPQDDLRRADAAKNKTNAAYPRAKRGGLILVGQPNSKI
jgi:hypothetical protein